MIDKLSEFMQSNPEGTLETIAADYQTSLSEVVKRLPGATVVTGQQFDKVWDAVVTWGEITFLVHTADIIAEFSGTLPSGYHRQGYFNLRHTQGLGGHIRADNCAEIAFIQRKFMGMDTASILFLNQQGAAMFKIFVGRDEHRQLKTAQLDAFIALAHQLGS